MPLVNGSGVLLADFTVKQGTVDLSAEFVVRHNSTTDLPTRFYLMRTAKITGPIIVTTSNYDAAIRYGVMRLSFFAAGIHWLFYISNGVFRYRTSTDGVSWSSATSIGEISGSGMACIYYDGTYLHYARVRDQILYYRRGIPSKSGSITWSAAEQTVYDNSPVGGFLHMSIAVLPGGYPVISYTRDGGGSTWKPSVIISDNNDGTWSGLEVETILNNTWDASWGTSLHELSGDLYVLYGRDNNNILGQEYSGGAWQGEEDTGYDTEGGVTWSATEINGEIHVTFIDDTNRDVYHGYRSVGEIWQAAVSVQTANDPNRAVGICVTVNTVYIFWADSDEDAIYYRKSLDNGATWTDEAGNNAPQKFLDSPEATYGYDFQIYEERMGGHIGMMWRGGTISPYTIYFADLGPLDPASGLDLFADFELAQWEVLYAKFEAQAITDLCAKFEVTHSENLYAKFEAQATAALKGIFETAQWGDLKGIFVARQASIVALKCVFTVRHTDTRDLYAKFTSQAVKDLYTKLIVRHSSGYPEANIKCTFSLYKPYANLFSKIRVRGAGTAELKAVFRVTAESLPAVFHVGQDSETLHGFFHVGQDSRDLSAEFVLKQASAELKAIIIINPVQLLFAKMIVNPVALLKGVFRLTQEVLPAEFTVRYGIAELSAEVEIISQRNLKAVFMLRHSTTKALQAELEIGLMLNEELKASFTVLQDSANLFCRFRVGETKDMFNMIGYNMRYLINTVDNIGRGFIGSPIPLTTEIAPNSRVAVVETSPHKAGSYKEITFGYRKLSEQELPYVRDSGKALYAKFKVRSDMRDFYTSSAFTFSMQPVYVADDHYKIEGRTTDFSSMGASLISWKHWASGEIQASIDLDPPATDDVVFFFGWSNAVPLISVVVGAYAALIYVTRVGWIFSSTEDSNGAVPSEDTDVSAYLDFNQHEIIIEREPVSGPYPSGRYLLYIDGVLRATHDTNLPKPDDLGAVFMLAQETSTTPLESIGVDIDNISLPS